MRLLIVRHGDPNYEQDTLTEVGWKEAEAVAERIAKMEVKEFYVSPLGRAKDTASCTLKKMNREAITCDWLREFSPRIPRPDVEGLSYVAWDWLPQDWTPDDRYYEKDGWMNTEIMAAGKVKEEYEWVCQSFDALLAEHGYVRDGRCYRVEKANSDTLVFFCHYGLECVLLSHLMGVSPMVLWHGVTAAPTSVTMVYTEERRKGIVSFRASCIGDTSHLYAQGMEPSFSARFCETYDNKNERHD